jgi:acetyltransferase
VSARAFRAQNAQRLEKLPLVADSGSVSESPAQKPPGSSSAATREQGNSSSLDSLFRPKSVAVIGATEREGTVGRTTFANLLASFRGPVYPVNPTRSQILGRPAYATVGKIPEPVDLALIVTPAATVPGIVGECVDAGVKAAVVISAGFRELGAEGRALEQKVSEQLARGHMRLIGPNCLGVMTSSIGLNATFAQTIARPGNVAFLSQSGALLTAILDWSLAEQVGFSGFVSTGSMLDVGWGDLIDYFGYDADTKSILIYMESVGDARSFLSAAREVAMDKPIIIIKAGRSEAASKAASSHTGALTGSDDVFDAALRRCGAFRVQRISDLFFMAEALSKQPRPKGPRLMIVTNAGGPAVLATDALIEMGGELAPLSDEFRASLDGFLPPHWSHGNPIDVLGDAPPDRYARAIELAINAPQSDGLLAILAPQGMTDPAGVAQRVSTFAHTSGKPLLASWMGAKITEAGKEILNAAGVPTFDYPDTAVRAFQYMWQYTYHLRGLYEAPEIADDPALAQERARKAARLVESVAAEGRTLLTEFESKELLKLYDIPTVTTKIAPTVDEAVQIAQDTGFPVVLKLHSRKITHKTDVGGVKLNLATADAVRSAFEEIESSVAALAGRESFEGVTVQPMVPLDGYELILGSSVDPQFGPVLLFGSGGQLVEVYRDKALGLPPLNTTLAQRLMEQTKIYTALKGVRGRKPVDMKSLEGLLARFSYIPIEIPRIKEIDINPLLASSARLVALDARVVLWGREVADADLPKPAIPPYPNQYIFPVQMKNGKPILIRPIRPEDERLMPRFHESLSEQTVYLRYFHMENLSQRVAHQRLLKKCFIDYGREMALVAETENPKTHEREILAVGRLTRSRDPGEAEVAVLVADRVQQQGIGSAILARLIEIARKEGITRIVADILAENSGMRALAARAGFVFEPQASPDQLRAVLNL